MVDNQFNNHQPISVSIGTAISQPGERVEDMLKRADTAMYEHKKPIMQKMIDRLAITTQRMINKKAP